MAKTSLLRTISVLTSGASPGDKRTSYPNPSRPAQTEAERQRHYEQMHAYYTNTTFEDISSWAKYKLKNNLYRWTRSIFNPFTAIVDFYAEHVYPGVLSPDVDLPNGLQSAIPLAHEVEQDLRDAVAQLWSWSNWQVGKDIMVTYGAMTGECLVEVIDDVEAGKIRYNVVWPGMVRAFQLDDFGNLEAYALEYEVIDRVSDKKYTYGKVVTRETIETFKDGQLFDFGGGASRTNPYPFIPAVWVKHIDIGGNYGVPAVRSGVGKIEEINSIVSHVADHIHKQINSPRIMWTDSKVTYLFGRSEDDSPDKSEFDSRNDQLLLKGRANGSTDTLVGNLDPATIVPLMEKFMGELERDFPEVTMYSKLRDQNIVTSPGARQMMGDVEKRVARCARNYDSASVRLFQMGVAIAGWRANSGDWGNALNRQQQKFLAFNFDSYNAGALDMSILPRTLIQETTKEAAEELSTRANAAAAVKEFYPLEELFAIMGKRPEEIPALVTKSKAEAEERMAQQVEVAKAQAAAKQPPGSNPKSQPKK